MSDEQLDIYGTPPEEWNRLHIIKQPGYGLPMPSGDEFFARQTRENPSQETLFNNLIDLIGDPRFALASTVGIIMKVGLWRSVENGELTHMQGAVLEQTYLRSLGRYEPRSLQNQDLSDLFDKVASIVSDSESSLTSVVNAFMQLLLSGFCKQDFTSEQIKELGRLNAQAIDRKRRLKNEAPLDPRE